MLKATVKNWVEEKRQQDYGVPAVFDVEKEVSGDEELHVERSRVVKLPWTEKYRVKKYDYEPRLQRPIPDAIPYVPPPAVKISLVRTANKKDNVDREVHYRERRQDRQNEMQASKYAKQEKRNREQKEADQKKEEEQVVDMADDDFRRHFTNEFEDLKGTHAQLPEIYHEQKYPHTLRETKYLLRKMNRMRRRLRDEALVRNEFQAKFDLTGKKTREVVPADNESTNDPEVSEQSTDDEDAMSVGQAENGMYVLRGFHYKLGDECRGLKDVKPKSKLERPKRTCITRKEWFDELSHAKRENALFKDRKLSMPSKALPNDPDYKLFRPFVIPPRPIHVAPIREMIVNPADPPKIIDAKVPKIKKPKYFKVRKFNLTAYIFGSQRRAKAKKVVLQDGATENKYGVSYDIIHKCDRLFKKRKNKNKAMRHNRMRVLGIPIIQSGKGESSNEESSESENSDWVPEQVHPQANARMDSVISLAGSNTSFGDFHRQNYSVSNMKAPDFREPTLRRHPRLRRKPSNSYLMAPRLSEDTVMTARRSSTPRHRSKLFMENAAYGGDVPPDDTVDPYAPYDVPRLSKLASDMILHPNLQVKRTQFTDMFGGRHHHPHLDPTQHKTVYVKYLPKIPTIQLPPVKKERAAKVQPFQRALFRQGVPLQEDLSLPKIKIEMPTVVPDDHIMVKQHQQEHHLLEAGDVAAHHRSRNDIDTSVDKSMFLQLLRDKNRSVVKTMGTADVHQQELTIDKAQFIEQLKAEMDSIKSCDSSNTSSVCTNFTNDSGSYLEFEDIKLPCDYVTKSHVPFEEIDRSRVIAGPLERHDEYFGPYYSVPFSGQQMDMRQLSLPKDKFFTSSVRSRFGIRNRLQVKVPGFAADQIGTRQRKYISQLATEWDSYYQSEILTRPRVRKFKRRTIIAQVRDAIRMKFETNYMQEAIIERSVITEQENKYAEEIENFRNTCQPLFTQWEESHYRSYMRKMQEVKPFYLLTDKLKGELEVARNKFARAEMSIIYMEDDWRRRTIMQNFHYLLSDPAWRVTHDWVHRNEADGTQENFRESIRKRPVVNLRARGQDSAWDVMAFYDKFFENEEARNVHIVFGDSREFMKGLHKLKMKSFMCLLELHFAMWVLANAQHAFNTFSDWSQAYIAKREKFVKNRCSKKYFLEDLASNLQLKAKEYVGEPLHAAVAAPTMRTLIAICETMFEQIISPAVRDNMKSGANVVDKFTMIANLAMDLLGRCHIMCSVFMQLINFVRAEQLDDIPKSIRQQAERTIRGKRAFYARQSERAVELENRIQQTLVQLRKNLAPPYRRPKDKPRERLARSVLPRKVIKKKEIKVEVTELDKLYYLAFTDHDVPQHMKFDNADDAAILRTLEANCIPFYFDVFLRQNNYFPVYDFKTEIELREGSEYKLFKFEDVLDDVQTNLRMWEAQKLKRMEEHIRQTWHLYQSRTV